MFFCRTKMTQMSPLKLGTLDWLGIARRNRPLCRLQLPKMRIVAFSCLVNLLFLNFAVKCVSTETRIWLVNQVFLYLFRESKLLYFLPIVQNKTKNPQKSPYFSFFFIYFTYFTFSFYRLYGSLHQGLDVNIVKKIHTLPVSAAHVQSSKNNRFCRYYVIFGRDDRSALVGKISVFMRKY